ncbi:hypothetical protein PROFUN_14865 [Planoprotostelium fungivorum]|uniref:Uncharacterized protein n=1 Tax=Planoprotostelium fungivorum TaxID=1890364 RepID=A0A2P6MYN5_9EUKA|nr:hypothetical protein PROFUN_14865 [Planoprotostelium fungivorum]
MLREDVELTLHGLTLEEVSESAHTWPKNDSVDKDFFGYLTVTLPTHHEGGAIKISTNREGRMHSPITTGQRIQLVFKSALEGKSPPVLLRRMVKASLTDAIFGYTSMDEQFDLIRCHHSAIQDDNLEVLQCAAEGGYLTEMDNNIYMNGSVETIEWLMKTFGVEETKMYQCALWNHLCTSSWLLFHFLCSIHSIGSMFHFTSPSDMAGGSVEVRTRRGKPKTEEKPC